MYTIDETGNAKWLCSLILLPQALSAPLIETDPQGQQVLMFAAEGEPIDPVKSSRPDPADVHPNYPALLSLSLGDGKYSAIGRDDIHGPGQFPVYAVNLRQLVPLGKETYVGYDRASGQLLRVRLIPR